MNGELALQLPSPLDETTDVESSGDLYYQFGREQVNDAIERFKARRAEENIPRTGVGRNSGWLARTVWGRLAVGASEGVKKARSQANLLVPQGPGYWHPAQVLLALGIVASLLRPSKADWGIIIGTITTLAVTHIHFLF